MEHQKPTTGKFSLQFGVLAGLAGTAFSIMLYTMGMAYEQSPAQSGISIAILFGIIFYGIYNFFKKYQITEDQKIESVDPETKDYLKLFLKGFLLNFANPLVIFYWFSVITLANQSVGTEGSELKQTVFLSVILVTFFLFDLLKILGAKQLKPLMTPYLFKQMNRLIGIVFFLFGLFLILQNIDLKALLNQVRI